MTTAEAMDAYADIEKCMRQIQALIDMEPPVTARIELHESLIRMAYARTALWRFATPRPEELGR